MMSTLARRAARGVAAIPALFDAAHLLSARPRLRRLRRRLVRAVHARFVARLLRADASASPRVCAPLTCSLPLSTLHSLSLSLPFRPSPFPFGVHFDPSNDRVFPDSAVVSFASRFHLFSRCVFYLDDCAAVRSPFDGHRKASRSRRTVQSRTDGNGTRPTPWRRFSRA